MNLSPSWVEFLVAHGVEAVHWSHLGDPRATDSLLMEWARNHDYAVFTHDLDFSALIAKTKASGPSILQVRAQDVLPAALGGEVVRALAAHRDELELGAIVTIDKVAARVRILPIRRGDA